MRKNCISRNSLFYLVIILLLLTICIFSYFTSIGLIGALLIEISKEFKTSIAGSGQLITISLLSAAIIAPIIGPFSDLVGRKRIVIFAQFILGISFLGYSFSQSFIALIMFSILHGFGGGMGMPNSLSLVSDYFPPTMYGRALSIIYGGQPIASLIGVPLGAFIAEKLGWQWSFFTLGIFTLLGALVTFFILRPLSFHSTKRRINYFSCFKEAFGNKIFLPILLGNILSNIAHFSVATYLAAFLREIYSLNVWEIAPFLLCIGFAQLFGIAIGGFIADKFNKIKIYIFTQIIAGIVSFPLMWFPKTIWFAVLLGGIFFGLYSGNRPAFLSLMVSLSENLRGTVMGIQAMSNRLGQALGAAIGGFIQGWMGYKYLGIICIILNFLASIMFLNVFNYLENGDQKNRELNFPLN